MANKRKAAVEPLQDDVIVKAERIEEARVADSTLAENVVQEKVISKEERIAEIQLMLEGIAYRKQLLLQKASEEAEAIQRRVTNGLAEFDKLIKVYSDELNALQATEKNG